MNRLVTIALLASTFCFSFSRQKTKRPVRVYVLTDISSLQSGVGEPDDAQSLVRFLFYANEFKIEGLGATYTSHKDTIYPQYIESLLWAYGKSLEKLSQHGSYPLAQDLVSMIKAGNSRKGTDQIGEGNDTELSEHIITVLKKDAEQPLWILIWGGSLDLAQALWKIKTTMPETEAKKLINALRVYSIADQYDKCGEWIRSTFKDLFFILNNGSFRGMYKGGDTRLASRDWVHENILSIPSALAQAYPNYDGGDPWGPVAGIKEGDTPSFLYLLPQSPGDPENPEMAGWGGEFKRIKNTNHYVDCNTNEVLQCSENIAQWRIGFQADFIRRLSWLK